MNLGCSLLERGIVYTAIFGSVRASNAFVGKVPSAEFEIARVSIVYLATKSIEKSLFADCRIGAFDNVVLMTASYLVSKIFFDNLSNLKCDKVDNQTKIEISQTT